MSEINWNNVKCYSDKVTPAYFNRLVDLCQSLTIEPGTGYSVSRTQIGTTFRIKGGGGSATPPPPFSVTLAPISGDTSDVSVSVKPGTANQFVPGNLFDSFTVAKTGTFYVKLAIETDGQNVTSVAIAVDSSEPDQQTATPNALPASFDILLAIVKDGKNYLVQTGNFMLMGIQSFIIDADPPAEPGQLTYTPYYVWNIATV